jgi:hypothetical protein
MHLNQSGVVYQTRIPRKHNNNMIVCIALVVVTSMSGCTGLNNSIPQALGINSAARVPPPGTGSFATPNNYTNNGPSANGNSAPGATPPAIGPKTSQFNPVEQPASQLLSTINNAQSRIQQVTGQARDTVNRTAESINSGVEAAGGRIDRFGQGVVQAGAILTEAAQPVGNINDQGTNNFAEDPNAAWRKPTR